MRNCRSRYLQSLRFLRLGNTHHQVSGDVSVDSTWGHEGKPPPPPSRRAPTSQKAVRIWNKDIRRSLHALWQRTLDIQLLLSNYRVADKSLARPDWKQQLKGRHLSSDAEVIAAAVTWLNGKISEFFLSGLQKSEFGHCSLFPFWSG